MEGKEYVVKDGDVMLLKFNVSEVKINGKNWYS